MDLAWNIFPSPTIFEEIHDDPNPEKSRNTSGLSCPHIAVIFIDPCL